MRNIVLGLIMFFALAARAEVLLGNNDNYYYPSVTSFIVLNCIDNDSLYEDLITGRQEFKIIIYFDVSGHVSHCFNVKLISSPDLVKKVINYINEHDYLEWFVDYNINAETNDFSLIEQKKYIYRLMEFANDKSTIPATFPIRFPVRFTFSKHLNEFLINGGNIPDRKIVMSELLKGLDNYRKEKCVGDNEKEIISNYWSRYLSLLIFNTTWYDILR